jgi:L-alanine-DL-glutamate epimerase-like enolase superfamily enzyme
LTTPDRSSKALTIRRVDAIPVALPLKTPMKMAGVTIAKAENLLVRIEARDGLVGWGEAASAPTMTGDTLGGLVAAVRDHLAPLLAGQDAHRYLGLLPALRRALVGNTGAHSAVEMALLDLIGQAAGKPLIEIVAKRPRRREVAPMWLLGNATPEEDAVEARAKVAEGFNLLKLKIAAKPLAADIATTLAVREALGSHVPLCADANGGLTPAAARRYLHAVRKAKLAFLEQPLGHDDLKGLAALARKTPMPIGIDEGIHSIADVDMVARCGAAGVSLKLIKLGGITTALEAAKLCRRLGLKVNVAAKIAESSIASAAAVQLACMVPNVDWGVSLTHFYLAEDIVRHPLPLRSGLVALPAGPGLGVEVDDARVERFRVR